tara:strand:- start:656 stop:1117 length:462 start_codon:yes stop_codon:yes gene_type:complete
MVRGVFIIVVIVIIAVVAVYVTFFYHPTCSSVECWDSKLRECSRATYVNNPADVTWEYTILGKAVDEDEEERCEVRVLAMDIKRGLKKTEILEGKEMVCYLPLGIVTAPEGNPNICQGRLKEEMQGLIIQKLHEYIVQNLGEIGEDVTSIPGV